MEHVRVRAHRLDDVEDLARAADRGVVLVLELAGGLFDVGQAQVGHAPILAERTRPGEAHRERPRASSLPLYLRRSTGNETSLRVETPPRTSSPPFRARAK